MMSMPCLIMQYKPYIVELPPTKETDFIKCDRICENRPPCTRYRNRDSAMNDVTEVWSRSGENLEANACIVLEIRALEARRVG